jgi:predicted nucleotidyltransferase
MDLKQRILNDLNSKLIIDPAVLVGRRIDQVYKDWNQTLYIRLGDLFCVVRAEPTLAGAELELDAEIDAWQDFENLTKIGVLSPSVHLEYQKWTKDKREIDEMDRKRKEYEALKKLFEENDLTWHWGWCILR